MKLLRLLALPLALIGGGAAQTVTVSAADLGGTTPITGTILFQPALSDGTLASAHISGGGISSRQILTATVTAGSFSIRVPDTSVTNPINLCYTVTVRATNGYQSLGPGFTCVQPAANNYWCTAGVCNFDAYLPSVPGLAVISAGPAGKDGVQGIQGIQGVPGPSRASRRYQRQYLRRQPYRLCSLRGLEYAKPGRIPLKPLECLRQPHRERFSNRFAGQLRNGRGPVLRCRQPLDVPELRPRDRASLPARDDDDWNQ